MSDQVRVKKSSDTSVSLWFDESFIAIKFPAPEDATTFLYILEDIIRYSLFYSQCHFLAMLSGTYLSPADNQDDEMMEAPALGLFWEQVKEMSSEIRCFTQEISSIKARILRLEREFEHSEGNIATA